MIGSTQRTRRRSKPWAIAAIAWALSANAAYAAQGNMHFLGTVSRNGGSCFMLVSSSGKMGVLPGARTMSSKWASGHEAFVDIMTFGYVNLSVSIDGPTIFSVAPPGGNDGVAFNASFVVHYNDWNARYAISGELASGQSFEIDPSLRYYAVRTHLVATRPTPFPAGDYIASTTVRCE